jgi:hypothetical protein
VIKPKVVVSIVNVAIVECVTSIALEVVLFPEEFYVRLMKFSWKVDTYLLFSKNSKVILMFFFTFFLEG